jgi:hypothetical protein
MSLQVPDTIQGEGKKDSVHSTKKDAMGHARHLAKRSDSGQVIVHGLNGQISESVTYGLPKIQDPPRKSRLGRKKIERAVSEVVLGRLN